MTNLIWLVFAGVVVLCRVVLKTYQKHLLDRHSESAILFVRDSVSLLLFIPLVVYVFVTAGFAFTGRSLTALLLSGVLNVIGALVVFAALKAEDASVVVPLTSFSPVLTALFEPFLRTTTVPFVVVLGGLLTAIGAAIVTADKTTIASLRTAMTSRGVLLALSANFIFGLTSILDGITTSVISPIYGAATITLFVLLGSVAGLVWQNDSVSAAITEATAVRARAYAVLGTLKTLSLTSVFFGFALAPSAAQASIAYKMNIVLVVFAGYFILNEGHLLRRLVGTTVILVGVALAVLPSI